MSGDIVITNKQGSISGKRIYTYVADDGTVFYSFTRYPTKVISGKRLYLQSRVGTHLLNFLSLARHLGKSLAQSDEPLG